MKKVEPISPTLSTCKDTKFLAESITEKAIYKDLTPLTTKPIKYDLSKCEIKFGDLIPEPEPILMFGDILVLSRGNIATVKGKAKARKSFFIAYLLQQFFEQNPDANALLLDTEQSKTFVYKLLKRVYKLMGWTKQNNRLKVLTLREYEVLQRRDVLIQAVGEFKSDFIVLDGGVDIICDFNNADESKQVAGLLMKLSTEYNCHILNVLHEGKTNGELRGHFGAEMLNKSETVFDVVKDGDVSNVLPNATRNAPFDEFSFSIDADGLPRHNGSVIRMTKTQANTENSKRFLTRILAPDKELNNTDLLDAYIELNMCSMKTAQNHIKKMFLTGFLYKNDKTKMYRLAKISD
jgi:hypothetical protein